MAGVQRPAVQVGRAQLGVGDARGPQFPLHRRLPEPVIVDRVGEVHPVIRAAASFPEMRTVGRPTPGVVPHPAKTALAIPDTRLRGRNGPVWKRVCAVANGVPSACPMCAPVVRGDEPFDAHRLGESGEAAVLQDCSELLPVARAEGHPVDSAQCADSGRARPRRAGAAQAGPGCGRSRSAASPAAKGRSSASPTG